MFFPSSFFIWHLIRVRDYWVAMVGESELRGQLVPLTVTVTLKRAFPRITKQFNVAPQPSFLTNNQPFDVLFPKRPDTHPMYQGHAQLNPCNCSRYGVQHVQHSTVRRYLDRKDNTPETNTDKDGGGCRLFLYLSAGQPRQLGESRNSNSEVPLFSLLFFPFLSPDLEVVYRLPPPSSSLYHRRLLLVVQPKFNCAGS